jgi:REP element-mobilizing transposase RayT
MSYTNLLYHIVYSTKARAPFITKDWRNDLHEYLGGTVRGLKSTALEIGGVDDHVHLLTSIPPTISVSEFMSKLKANSSHWAKQRSHKPFSWQEGYSAFSVSESRSEAVGDYIRRQEVHHQKASFADELRQLLERHNISYDETSLLG